MSVVLQVLFWFAALYGIVAGAVYLRSRILETTGALPLDVPMSLPVRASAFESSGTIGYIREGTGQVNTYFYYYDADGDLKTKILSSPRRISFPAGQSVHVAGSVRHEALFVETIYPLENG
jgi:hypothetical protein